MTLYCIRHLSTEYNLKGWLQGSMDISVSPMSESDESTVVRNSSVLDKISFDTILVSELKRTQQTANAYGISNYVVEPLANELNFGKYEGKLKSIFLDEHGDQWKNDPLSLTLGEELKSLEKRIKDLVVKYRDMNNVLLFSHGAFTRGLLSYSLHGSINHMNKYKIANNSLSKIEFA